MPSWIPMTTISIKNRQENHGQSNSYYFIMHQQNLRNCVEPIIKNKYFKTLLLLRIVFSKRVSLTDSDL